MRFTPVSILSFFAVIWLAMGLAPSGLSTAPVILAAAAVSTFLAWSAWRVDHASATRLSAEERRRINRIVLCATTAEWIAILLASNILISHGLVAYQLCAIAIIVGLHFIPLARIPRGGLYKGTAIALASLGAAGLLLPAGLRDAVVGTGGACICWATAAVIVARGAINKGDKQGWVDRAGPPKPPVFNETRPALQLCHHLHKGAGTAAPSSASAKAHSNAGPI